MPKIISNSKGVVIKYLIKIFVSSVFCIIVFNLIFTLLILKLDIDLKYCQWAGAIIAAFSSLVVSSFSTKGFKFNYFALSLISVTPLAIFVLINFLIYNSSIAIFAIKEVVVYTGAIIVALIKARK